ncbi:hypothetical protein DFH06DRAFT_1253443 [Mycena polygramma]|nr:hypothetical protein DFH06DRAFT_1253443 [Mycena polygramma]
MSSLSIDDVPPEIWSVVARFSSRQSLGRLCAVSHKFWTTISVLLYSDTIDPPITIAASWRLMVLLSKEDAPVWKPHPATLLRRLHLADGRNGFLMRLSTGDEAQTQAALNSIKNTYRSALRALKWDMSSGLDDLGQILGNSAHFPNLRELDIYSNGTNTNFDFLQIQGLEVLKLDFTLHVMHYLYNLDAGNALCSNLSEAIETLPASSPHLHTLQLHIKIPLDMWIDNFFPHSGYGALVAAINLLHLPALAVLDLSLNLNPRVVVDGLDVPDDFGPFLSRHPDLLDLTLFSTFLPCLRSFAGSFEHSSILCAGDRPLETLTLRLPLQNKSSLMRWPPHPTLSRLRVVAIDKDGRDIDSKYLNVESTMSFAAFASSHPRLTHLDVCKGEWQIKAED